MILHRLLPAALCLCLLLPTRGESAEVVASIKPLHSIASSVMLGAGAPRLLVSGSASPHAFALKPSDAAALKSAALVLWIGPELESALEKPLATLVRPRAIMTVLDLPGLKVVEAREGGVWAGHAHDGNVPGHMDHDHHKQAHAHGRTADGAETPGKEHHRDPHIWLDPANARVIANAFAEALARLEPANAALYRANAAAFAERLEALEREIEEAVGPLRGKPYVVFHDAYRYFEDRFGLEPAGAIAISPDRQPGARRVSEIRDTIIARKAACVFAEPQFEPRLQRRLVEVTGAKAGVLDPLGAELAKGPELYFSLMRNLTANLADCLLP